MITDEHVKRLYKLLDSYLEVLTVKLGPCCLKMTRVTPKESPMKLGLWKRMSFKGFIIFEGYFGIS